MTALDIFTFIVMAVLLVVAAVVVAMLGAMPGKIARRRNHPQAEAINVCGWLGIITLGLAWPVAFVWAYTRPAGGVMGQGDERVEQTIAELSGRLSIVEEQLRNSGEQRGEDGS